MQHINPKSLGFYLFSGFSMRFDAVFTKPLVSFVVYSPCRAEWVCVPCSCCSVLPSGPQPRIMSWSQVRAVSLKSNAFDCFPPVEK